MTKLWMAATVGSLFVIFGVFAYFKGGPRHASPDKPGSSEELAALRAELADLKRTSATHLLFSRVAGEHEPQLTAPSAASAASAATLPAPETPKRQSQQEQDEETRRLELARAESLDRQFEAEAPDRAWAPLAEQEARRALQTEVGSDTSVNHIDCRATWCRIETVHRDVESFKAFADKSLLSRQRQLWNGGVNATIRDDSAGSVVAVTFITREGHAMPLPEGEESAVVDLGSAAR
jgi:hypothetical protein